MPSPNHSPLSLLKACPPPRTLSIYHTKRKGGNILNRDKLKNIPLKFTSNRENYMDSFRKNIDLYIEEKAITVKEISELADIPFSTLSSFLYGDSTDCKLSTAVKLARALGVSVDELIGAETIGPITKESLRICRTLPEHAMYLIRYFIRHQKNIYVKRDSNHKEISVLFPQTIRGRLLTTTVTKTYSVEKLPEHIQTSVYLGIRIPDDSEFYMPYFAPGEIILVAADRDAVNGERCVVTHNGRIFIVEKRSYIDGGIKKWKYVALMNDKIEIKATDIDDKVGYIIGFMNPDGSWGRR